MGNNIINNIDSENTDYVMRRIRERYIGDSTVTIVLLGDCTWARCYVDWEIQASLYQREGSLPNGLLGIRLPSTSSTAKKPDRLERNVTSGYAKVYKYTYSVNMLAGYINKAFFARQKLSYLIDNPMKRREKDSPC
jgi:hypothetical protein